VAVVMRTAGNVADGVRGDDDCVCGGGPGDDDERCELVAGTPPHTGVRWPIPEWGVALDARQWIRFIRFIGMVLH